LVLDPFCLSFFLFRFLFFFFFGIKSTLAGHQ
jgi:hypothetical protein